MYGRNGQSICLLSPFFCPSSKIAQPKYAKGASERARSASVYGTYLIVIVNSNCANKRLSKNKFIYYYVIVMNEIRFCFGWNNVGK